MYYNGDNVFYDNCVIILEIHYQLVNGEDKVIDCTGNFIVLKDVVVKHCNELDGYFGMYDGKTLITYPKELQKQ